VNSSLTTSVLAPPIPDFKAQCRSIQPATGHIFDLSQAVPSYPTFPKIREAVAQSVTRDEVGFYTDVPGLFDLRKAIADTHFLISDRDPNRVLITSGANHAMFTALMLHCNAGDTVLLLEPFYFNYDMALPMLGLKADYLSVAEADGMQLHAKKVIARLEANPAIRAVILITPNNPTGACYAAEEVLEVVKWASPRGVEVIVDETYLKFDPHHLNQSALSPYLGKGLTLVGSFSKCYSLTGYRVGYLVTSPDILRESLKIQDTVVICPSHIGQIAALEGIRVCEEDVRREVARMGGLADKVREATKALRAFRLISAGSFFAYFKHPFTHLTSAQASLHLFEATGIIGLPGTVFGKSQEAYIRLSISNVSENDLDRALGELIRFDDSCATRAKEKML
jgi:aspartate/methionine/tyrosine aminotransferase